MQINNREKNAPSAKKPSIKMGKDANNRGWKIPYTCTRAMRGRGANICFSCAWKVFPFQVKPQDQQRRQGVFEPTIIMVK